MYTRLCLVVTISVIGLSYWLYTPLPEDMPSHLHIKIHWYGIIKTGMLFGDIYESLGLGNGIEFKRHFVLYLGYYYAWLSGTDDGSFQQYDTHFDGVRVRVYKPLPLKDIDNILCLPWYFIMEVVECSVIHNLTITYKVGLQRNQQW